MRLEPIVDVADADDPFFALGGLADPKAKLLSNQQIDREIYSK